MNKKLKAYSYYKEYAIHGSQSPRKSHQVDLFKIQNDHILLDE